MWEKIANLLKTCYARATCHEQPDPEKWVFSSVHNRAFNYNSSALFQYVKEYHPEIQAFYVMEDPGERERLQERFGKESVIDTSTIEGIRKVLACKVWFTSTAPPLYGVGFRKKYRIINLWHGVPLKKIGMKQENLGRLTKLYYKYLFADNYEAVVTTSEELIPVMSRSFLVEPERVKVWGQPRNDKLFQKMDAGEQMKNIFRGERLPEFTRLLLYAPTFRDHGETKVFPFPEFEGAGREAALKRLQEFLEKHQSMLCIRMHLYEKEGYEWLRALDHPGSRIRFLNEDRVEDIMEVLAMFDLLITDYSSVFFDYANLRRPILFFMYDYEQYKHEMRDFYFDIHMLPGPVLMDQEEVLKTLKNLPDVVDKYEKKYVEFNNVFNPHREQCSEKYLREWMK